jgi:hypothetical protein
MARRRGARLTLDNGHKGLYYDYGHGGTSSMSVGPCSYTHDPGRAVPSVRASWMSLVARFADSDGPIGASAGQEEGPSGVTGPARSMEDDYEGDYSTRM